MVIVFIFRSEAVYFGCGKVTNNLLLKAFLRYQIKNERGLTKVSLKNIHLLRSYDRLFIIFLLNIYKEMALAPQQMIFYLNKTK